MISILCASFATLAQASELMEVEQVVVARLDEHQKQTEQVVKDASSHCRDDMQQWADVKTEEYYDDLKNVFWMDRAITFFLIFFALFLSKVFFRWWDFKNAMKIKELEKLGEKGDDSGK